MLILKEKMCGKKERRDMRNKSPELGEGHKFRYIFETNILKNAKKT